MTVIKLGGDYDGTIKWLILGWFQKLMQVVIMYVTELVCETDERFNAWVV